MTDTTILGWQLLKKEYNKDPDESRWLVLKRHEEYMLMKGFLIGLTSVITPEGEKVCLNS